MLTKITEVRKQTRNNSSNDIEKIIEHLLLIQKEKEEEELELLDVVNKQESARLKAVSVLESNGMLIPAELAKEITLESFLKRPRRRGRKRKVETGTNTTPISKSTKIEIKEEPNKP